MGYALTKQGEDSWSAHDQPEVKLKLSLLHPDYLAGTFPTLMNVGTGGFPDRLGRVFARCERCGGVAADAVRSELPHETPPRLGHVDPESLYLIQHRSREVRQDLVMLRARDAISSKLTPQVPTESPTIRERDR
jgi:hypothetical protein